MLAFVNEALAKKFGRVLSTYRRKNGFTQESLAFECELDRTYISLLERGQRQPSLSTIFSLANALNLQPQTLIAATAKK